MNWIGSALESLKLSPRYLVAIAVFCLLLLALPDQTAEFLGIHKLTQDYRQFFGLGLLATGILIGVHCGIVVTKPVGSFVRRKKLEKRIAQRLHCLTEEEKEILRYYAAEQSKTNVLREDDGIVNGLVAAGVIYRAASRGNLVEGFAHNISEFAWKYLHENQGLLIGKSNFYRTDKRGQRGLFG